uniref:Uncharacterized protein n=1 Tax=Ditylenchus dipsaci TaxID=166011 RepID=A0A915EJC6_9BILA
MLCAILEIKLGGLALKVDPRLKRVIRLEPDDETCWESELQVSSSYYFLEVYTDCGLCLVNLDPITEVETEMVKTEMEVREDEVITEYLSKYMGGPSPQK